MESFLPEDYKLPTSSSYLKLTEGEHTFRVMSSAVVGYEYFTTENKPVRSKESFNEIPNDIKTGGRILPFWAFIVWNCNEKKIQIMELTQKTIMQPIQVLVKNPKWGDPKSYDITITRKGMGLLDTEYSVMPNPHSDMPEEAKEAFMNKPIKLENLYLGEDPFVGRRS